MYLYMYIVYLSVYTCIYTGICIHIFPLQTAGDRSLLCREEKSRAELELLLTDEHGGNHGVKGYNLKKTQKDKRKDKENISEKLPTVNYDDPRFSALFTSHRYAIDPTEPEFKRFVLL